MPHASRGARESWFLSFFLSYLRVFEAELLGELLPVRLGYVLLHLEPLLEALTLVVGEHGAPEHSAPRFAWKSEGRYLIPVKYRADGVDGPQEMERN